MAKKSFKQRREDAALKDDFEEASDISSLVKTEFDDSVS